MAEPLGAGGASATLANVKVLAARWLAATSGAAPVWQRQEQLALVCDGGGANVRGGVDDAPAPALPRRCTWLLLSQVAPAAAVRAVLESAPAPCCAAYAAAALWHLPAAVVPCCAAYAAAAGAVAQWHLAALLPAALRSVRRIPHVPACCGCCVPARALLQADCAGAQIWSAIGHTALRCPGYSWCAGRGRLLLTTALLLRLAPCRLWRCLLGACLVV